VGGEPDIVFVKQHEKNEQPPGADGPIWRNQHPSKVLVILSVQLQMVADHERWAIRHNLLAINMSVGSTATQICKARRSLQDPLMISGLTSLLRILC